MADTWQAITFRFWGDYNADGSWHYEREVTEHETEEEAWERASSDMRHSERKDELVIIDPDGDACHYRHAWSEQDQRMAFIGHWC